jgi:putative transposase
VASGDPGDFARLGVQLLLQAALEAEFLGRDRYQRAACNDGRPDSRNGYGKVTVKTARLVMVSRPEPRGRPRRSRPRCSAQVTKTNALETLVIASFLRGLSVPDVTAALTRYRCPAVFGTWYR